MLKVSLARRLKTFQLDKVEENENLSEAGGLMPVTFDKLIISEKVYAVAPPAKKSGLAIRDVRDCGAGFAEHDYYNGQFNQNGAKGKEIWDGVEPGFSKTLIVDIPVPVILFNLGVCQINSIWATGRCLVHGGSVDSTKRRQRDLG